MSGRGGGKKLRAMLTLAVLGAWAGSGVPGGRMIHEPKRRKRGKHGPDPVRDDEARQKAAELKRQRRRERNRALLAKLKDGNNG